MFGVRRVDYVQKQRILNYNFAKEKKAAARPTENRSKRKRRPVSVVLNEGNLVDVNVCSASPQNPFLNACKENDERSQGNGQECASLVDWSSYPDEVISPLISYFATSDEKCLLDSVYTGSSMLLTLKASHDLNSFESQIILTKAIYSVLKDETWDDVLETLVYARENRLNHLLTLLDCDICENFAVVNFHNHLKHLTIGDLCTWLRTASHLKISSADYLRYANDQQSCLSIYECSEEQIFGLVTNWLKHDPKTRIDHLPELMKLDRWNSITRPLERVMAIDEVRNYKAPRRLVKRTLSSGSMKNERPRCNRLTLALLGSDLFQPKYLRDVLTKLDEDDRKRSSFLFKNQKMIRSFFDNHDKRRSCMYIALPRDVRVRPPTQSVVYDNDVVFVSWSGKDSRLMVYRCETSTARVTKLPSPKFHRVDNFSVSVVNGKLLLIGGTDKHDNVVLDIEMLDLTQPDRLRWTKIPRIPLLKTWWKQTCCNYKGRLFCWFVSPTGLNATYLFNFDTEEWTFAISNWQTPEEEMPDDGESNNNMNMVSIEHDRYVVILFGRCVYAFDLMHNDMVRLQLSRSSERDVPFAGGFYRYNVDDSGSINTLLLIHPKQLELLNPYLSDGDTYHTLFENNLAFVSIANSISIPYLPDSCILSAVEMTVNRDLYCKLDNAQRSNLWTRIREATRRSFLSRGEV